MTKHEAIEELEELLHYWRDIKFYNNKSEQEAVEFAIDYMTDSNYYIENNNGTINIS